LPRRFITDGIPPVRATPGICDLPLSRFTYAKELIGGGAVACLDFSSDGMNLCVGEPLNRKISSFDSTGSGWELDEYVLFGQYDILDGGDNLANIDGMRYADNGNQLWISAHTGLVAGKFIKYTLNTPYLFDSSADAPTRIGEASANGDTSIVSTFDISMKPDGTSIIGYGNDSGNNLYQYDMTSLDIATLLYEEKSSTAFAHASFIPPSGNCLYAGSTNTVNMYSFGTSWSASTLGATLQDSLYVGAKTSVIDGLFVTEDRLFVLGGGNLYQYNA
jgi:hypothetical protein